MLGQYKKIAITTNNNKYSLYCPGGNNTRTETFTIPLNVSFKPSIIILTAKGYGYNVGAVQNSSKIYNPNLNSNKNFSVDTGFSDEGTYNGRWWIENIRKESFNLNVKISTVNNQKSCWLVPPLDIIAIG